MLSPPNRRHPASQLIFLLSRPCQRHHPVFQSTNPKQATPATHHQPLPVLLPATHLKQATRLPLQPDSPSPTDTRDTRLKVNKAVPLRPRLRLSGWASSNLASTLICTM